VIKSRIVNLKHVTAQAVDAHLRYIAREGVGHDGRPTQPYGPGMDVADRQEFAAAGREDRHQFRFIVAPEDGVALTDLRDFTRELMSTIERDLGTKLEWIAVDHWDTDNPHTHVVLRGTDDRGKDLINSHRKARSLSVYLGVLEELLAQNAIETPAEQLTARQLFEVLQEQGYRGSYYAMRYHFEGSRRTRYPGTWGTVQSPRSRVVWGLACLVRHTRVT
jgi:hypothetical protein